MIASVDTHAERGDAKLAQPEGRQSGGYKPHRPNSGCFEGLGQVTGIELPFPPASLSGHNKGHYHAKSAIVKKHREWAKSATLAAMPDVPKEGDIRVSVTFYPPNKRGDRVNFPNRCKPYFDGIADALKTNDSRFLPAYYFAEPVHNARVVVVLS